MSDLYSAGLSEQERLTALAPRPQTLAETGLSQHFMTDLLAKHLQDAGQLSSRQLMQRLALAGPIVETIIEFMRQEKLLEVHAAGGRELAYQLTDRGRARALDALQRSGYTGPAPVPLAQYNALVEAQSVHAERVNRSDLEAAFDGIVLAGDLKDQLGPAVNSGRAIFIYGPAGTGKTYITQKLTRLFPQACLIPSAVAVGEQVIGLFDPQVHKPLENTHEQAPQLMLQQGHDPRYRLCERPELITGGELSMDMLEVHFNPVNRTYTAPLQMKANNGIFIIDDMGRQHASPMEVFNRWIVPMEEKRDYLTLGAGRHFQVPFDQVLVFSSNINPLELADEAFLRRIGYKIYFGYLTARQYGEIWRQVCAQHELPFDPELLSYAIDNLHGRNRVGLRPCHPRDLLGMALDRLHYQGDPTLSTQHLDWAWNSYFVRLSGVTEDAQNASRGGDHV